MVNETVELKLEEFRSSQTPSLQSYAGNEDGQVAKDLVQSRLMFAELVMVVVTGFAVARL